MAEEMAKALAKFQEENENKRKKETEEATTNFEERMEKYKAEVMEEVERRSSSRSRQSGSEPASVSSGWTGRWDGGACTCFLSAQVIAVWDRD